MGADTKNAIYATDMQQEGHHFIELATIAAQSGYLMEACRLIELATAVFENIARLKAERRQTSFLGAHTYEE